MSIKTGAAKAQTTKPAKVEKTNAVLANENLLELKEQHATKSSLIRYLTSKGYTRSDIANALGIRYQHVRNVQTTPLMSEEKEKRAKAKAEQDKAE